MTSQRLEKWLEAASDGAAYEVTVDFDLAHSRRPFYSLGGRGADETDLHSLYGYFRGHWLPD
ncbi:MAG: hypothetical protein DLM67_24210 [Candidatus Nephthysia bennettiae]|nr:MAG: hypothetical protein DLM67_24210 [Candidatus Dormibacteraeota bacterium]